MWYRVNELTLDICNFPKVAASLFRENYARLLIMKSCSLTNKMSNMSSLKFAFPQLTSSSFHVLFHSLVKMNSTNWPACNVRVFIDQLVEHCSANAGVMGSNPVEVPTFGGGVNLPLLKVARPSIFIGIPFYMKAIIYAYSEYWTLCKQICCLLDVSATQSFNECPLYILQTARGR